MNPYRLSMLNRSYWKHGFSLRNAIMSLLSCFGALWLSIEIANYFNPELQGKIRPLWPWFFALGLIMALWANKPKHKISCRLASRDVTISIEVGDIFSMEGAYVIGACTSFETMLSDRHISPSSLQGQFTKKFYSSADHLGFDVRTALHSVQPIEIIDSKPHYDIGTCIKLRINDKTAYFIAISKLNNHGTAESSFENIKLSLASLWDYIQTHGDYNQVVIPILGSGFSRIPVNRFDIIIEILNSFVASCASKKPCESLTIVISHKDFYKNNINIYELDKYLSHLCNYTNFRLPSEAGLGRPTG